MKTTAGVLATAAVVGALTLGGCGGEEPSGPALPNLVGQRLDQAKTAAQTAGFRSVTSRDAQGTRSQYVDENWFVCRQSPIPGPTEPTTPVELGVLKYGESCPGLAPPVSTSPTPTTTTTTSKPPSTSADVDADADRPYVPVPDRGSGSESGGSGDDGSSGGGGSAYYANCKEAKAAGAAPLYRGQPGYRKGLDRGGDGVACE